MNPETSPRFSGIGGHHSHKAGTVEWLTPPAIIAALGPFDLDPCAPVSQPWPTAARTFSLRENGLLQKWEGRVWLNPPYANGELDKWLARLAEHGRGTALIFARTETDAFFEHVWGRATVLMFVRGRLTFHVGEPHFDRESRRWCQVGELAPGNAGAPSVFCAYGDQDADRLARSGFNGVLVGTSGIARQSTDQLALWEAFDAPA